MHDGEEIAREFLQASGTKINIHRERLVEGFPNHGTDHLFHYKYKVTLSRNGKRYTFNFYDSYHHYLEEHNPFVYDVLASLYVYQEVPENIYEFANEFGYDAEKKETLYIWHDLRRQNSRLFEFFGSEWMERLAEIV